MTLLNRLKSLIKIGRLTSSDDSGNLTRGTAFNMGKDSPVLIMKQYGVLSRPPKGSLCVLLSQNGQDSNTLALVDDPKRRTIKDLVEGEAALTNQVTQDYIYLKDGNEIEIKTDTVTILTGSTIVTITDGQVTIDSADVEINGNLQVNGTITNTSTIQSGATITSGGDVLTSGGKSLDGHVHAGSPTAPTGAISNTGAPV